MHAIDFLNAETGNQAVLHHRLAARAALFSWLEDHHGGAGKVAGLGEVFGGAEQHRGVAVMAAGVHLSRHFGFVWQAGFFLERQRIHVSAQADDLVAGLAALNDPDHAGAADAGYDVVAAEAFQLVGDGGRGLVNVIEQLRMHVHFAPPGGDFAMHVGDTIDDRHRRTPQWPVRLGCGQPSKGRRKKRARLVMAGVFQYLPASERVAQLVEHVTFNHGVVGSSPTALTN